MTSTRRFAREGLAALALVGALASGPPGGPPAWAGGPVETALPALPPPAMIRGLLVSLERATISSRLQATIERIGPENGEAFRAGDVLIAFDCASFRAELARAAAEEEAAEGTLRIKEELARSGSISRLQIVLASAELKRTRAAREVAEKQVSECIIRAPFDGRVVRRIANAFETVGFRDPLIEIVGTSGIEVRAFVPSRWLRALEIGGAFDFRIDETGETLPVRILAIGAAIDNVSQLVEVRGRITAAGGHLVAGMSGEAIFPQRRAGPAEAAATGSIAP